MTEKQKKFLTVGEAAEFLGVHEQTIRRYISNGLLKANRYSPKSPRKIPIEEIRRLLNWS